MSASGTEELAPVPPLVQRGAGVRGHQRAVRERWGVVAARLAQSARHGLKSIVPQLNIMRVQAWCGRVLGKIGDLKHCCRYAAQATDPGSVHGQCNTGLCYRPGVRIKFVEGGVQSTEQPPQLGGSGTGGYDLLDV